MKRILLLIALALLSGCATFQPHPASRAALTADSGPSRIPAGSLVGPFSGVFGTGGSAQLPIYCNASTQTPCSPSTNPGNGTEGDPAWVAFGKADSWCVQLGLCQVDALNEVLGTGTSGVLGLETLSAADIASALSTSSLINGSTVPDTAGTLLGSTGTFTAGDCLKVGSTSPLEAADAGAACGSGAGGGISSVGITVPSFLTVTGSPLTANGTIAIAAGTGLTTHEFLSTSTTGTLGLNAIAAADLPASITSSTTGNAATATTATEWGGQALPPLVSGDFITNDGTSLSWGTPTAAASSVTPGTTTVSGATAPCMLDNSTSATMGCAAIGAGLTLISGTLNTAAVPNRTAASPTVDAADMGGEINLSSGTLTIPAISSTVFATGQSLVVVNYSASTAAVSTTPTVNSGGGCVTATGIPAGDTWMLLSNGTTIDCIQTLPSLMPTVNAATAAISVTPSCAINGEITNVTSTAYTISAPTNGALTATAGGTLAATTYYVQSTWVTASGQTVGSTETSLAVAADNVLNVAAPASPPATATAWDVYVSTATGTETLQASGIGTATAWVEPTTGLVAGAALPATNTSGLFTFDAPTGCTPVDGQKIQVNVNMASGGAASYAANAIYLASSSLALPTTSSGASLQDDFLFQYSTTFSKWKFLTVNQGF